MREPSPERPKSRRPRGYRMRRSVSAEPVDTVQRYSPQPVQEYEPQPLPKPEPTGLSRPLALLEKLSVSTHHSLLSISKSCYSCAC